ncbi:MAG: prephenate dehydrogenase/arogenate dehydrogenase family protein [bacterium]|nr:prephenate dehydrogenase/arogenate dehydrogenase family protein [bacterium]
MKTQIVGIIGVNGKFGQFFKIFFEKSGYTVTGSDVMTEVTNRHVVEQSDVVIFSVPINSVVSVVNEVVKFSRVGQLFMDVTSIKSPAVEAMMRSKADVVGLHPMFAPTVETFRGQVIVRCDARLTDTWSVWVQSFLESTKATIKKSTPEEHDKHMTVVQALPHAVSLMMARVIDSMGINVLESMSYTSPFYKIAFGLMGRILSKDSAMYASIQMENLHVPEALEELEHEIKRFRAIIETKDKGFRAQVFNADFEASKKHFGKEPIASADKFFDDVIGLMADFSEENMFVLEAGKDQSGIAHQITGIFAGAGVNLTSFHSQKIKEGKFRFLVGFDKPKDSPAIKAIESKINEIPYVKIVQ